MVNSHYVPQFILKGFCNNDKIIYCDINNKKTELRNTRSIFSEKGYYPDTLEKDLCKKAEYLFANLFHNKLENARNTLTLTADDLFVLKKYLIVSSIRYKYEYSEDEMQMAKKLGAAFQVDFVENLNNILRCENTNDLFAYMEKVNKNFVLNKFDKMTKQDDINVPLWAEMKDIIYSYIVFIKAQGAEKFIISDIGKGIYEGPMSKRKMFGLLEAAMQQGNPTLLQIATMLTPHDYTIYPLTKDLAILSMSTFFKLFTESEIKSNVILPVEYPTLSSILGFGNSDVIKPPKVKMNRGIKEYKYEVQRLSAKEVSHFNCLMMAEAKKYIACAGLETVKTSVDLVKEYTDRDFSFMNIDKESAGQDS